MLSITLISDIALASKLWIKDDDCRYWDGNDVVSWKIRDLLEARGSDYQNVFLNRPDVFNM